MGAILVILAVGFAAYALRAPSIQGVNTAVSAQDERVAQGAWNMPGNECAERDYHDHCLVERVEAYIDENLRAAEDDGEPGSWLILDDYLSFTRGRSRAISEKVAECAIRGHGTMDYHARCDRFAAELSALDARLRRAPPRGNLN